MPWEQLNPARGDASPRAADLWGDRKKNGATGFLVRFVDGFQSPPHIHNVTYRGVVLKGLVHNDDPKAEAMWMPPGSFWTQPKGEVHITSAKGADTIAYIEIDEGPYLVRPVEQAFVGEERPVNVDATNIVWVDAPDAPGLQLAYLWGDPNGEAPYGMFVKLAADALLTSRSLHAVVVEGTTQHRTEGSEARLDPGSFFHAEETTRVGCEAGPCVVYLRVSGRLEASPAPSD